MIKTLPELVKDKRGVRDIIAASLEAQMDADPRVCYLDADLMNCIGTRKLAAKYPLRAINCGIAESNMIGVAAGMSAAGMIPYAHTFGIFASRRVMDQGDTPVNGPHQGGWVRTASGEDLFIHFQDKGCYGRVTWLEPMKWVDGWPVIGEDPDGDGCGQPVLTYRKPVVPASVVSNPAESDEFDTPDLGLQWQWHSNYQDLYGFTTPYGFLRLYSWPLSAKFTNLWEVSNLLLQKFPADAFTATTKVTVVSKEDGQEGGLMVMGWDYSALTVRREGDRFVLLQRTCKDAEQGGKEKVAKLESFEPSARETIIYSPTVSREIYLRVQVEAGGMCRFAYSLDGQAFTACGEPFQARQGKWIGAKVGFLCVEPHAEPAVNRGWMNVDWFRVTP